MQKAKHLKAKAKASEARKFEQLEFFSATITGASPKDDRHSMAVPFFTLSKKIDTDNRTYFDQDGYEILRLEPSGRGLATIWDKDILLFCMSQIMAAKNRKQPYSKTISVDSFAVLTATGRGTSGPSYENLEDALIRLRGTTVLTPIATGGEVVTEGFGFIESFKIVSQGRSAREVSRKGGKTVKKQAVLSFEVTLSEWIFNALRADEVLTLDPDYFSLKGVLGIFRLKKT
ncbi:MAG: replication initiator protein A [Candidatus Thiodiazotropha sp.]|nr:replication initiator protein A [Candidatus Thiodiazotropha sp.]